MGGKFPFVAKTVENRSDMMKREAIAIPNARCIPLPPRLLLRHARQGSAGEAEALVVDLLRQVRYIAVDRTDQELVVED